MNTPVDKKICPLKRKGSFEAKDAVVRRVSASQDQPLLALPLTPENRVVNDRVRRADMLKTCISTTKIRVDIVSIVKVQGPGNHLVFVFRQSETSTGLQVIEDRGEVIERVEVVLERVALLHGFDIEAVELANVAHRSRLEYSNVFTPRSIDVLPARVIVRVLPELLFRRGQVDVDDLTVELHAVPAKGSRERLPGMQVDEFGDDVLAAEECGEPLRELCGQEPCRCPSRQWAGKVGRGGVRKRTAGLFAQE